MFRPVCYIFTNTAVKNSSFDYDYTTSDTCHKETFSRTVIIQNTFNFMSHYKVIPIFQIMKQRKKITLCKGKYSMLHKCSAILHNSVCGSARREVCFTDCTLVQCFSNIGSRNRSRQLEYP